MKSFLIRLVQNSGLIIISLGLMYGGIAILRTQIPFWSLLYGIPAVFLGIIMSLISFNEIAKNGSAKSTEYHKVSCRVCGNQTLVPMLAESAVCSDCQYKMAVRLQMTALVFFAVVAIPVTFHLTQTAQDIRQKAYEVYKCESGSWSPTLCRCGKWIKNEITLCSSKIETLRSCSDNKLYCCENIGHQSACHEINPK